MLSWERFVALTPKLVEFKVVKPEKVIIDRRRRKK